MSRNVTFIIVALIAAALVSGCASKTPLEQALESRAAYKANLNSFFVRETPLVDAAAEAEVVEAEADDEAVEEAVEEAVGEDGEPLEVEVPTRTDAVLDIIVQHDTADPLPGVTLDITMVDGERNEVGHWTVYVDTEGLPKANQRPVTHILEGVDYEEGYGFNVEVRDGIPPAEYGDYQELSGLGG